MNRIAFINSIIGRPYQRGAQGPDAFECYSLTRYVQQRLFGRDLPIFQTPDDIGVQGVAGLLAAHPERRRWRPVSAPEDGAVVTMFRQGIGHHIGTWIKEDRGLILHATDGIGVTAEPMFRMQAPPDCWNLFKFYVPK